LRIILLQKSFKLACGKRQASSGSAIGVFARAGLEEVRAKRPKCTYAKISIYQYVFMPEDEYFQRVEALLERVNS
jgi:hypothetical protein